MKHSNQRSSLKKKKKYNRSMPQSLIDRDLVLSYLQGPRDEALENIAYSLGTFNYNEIKPILKKSIHDYARSENLELDGSIHIKECIYHMLANFDTSAFFNRKWQYVPYYLNKHDYTMLQNCKKYPIHIENYDYSSPVYELKNNFLFANRKKKRENRYSEEKVKNDVQFYIAKDENILFAKLITLKYKPINLRFIKENYRMIEVSGGGILDADKAKDLLVENEFLYNRSLSISMYVLLYGDPNKAMPFLRYDSEEGNHNNVFIGDDKRKAIFGTVANGPHFHFQNETDSLLCLAKFTGDEDEKYKTGRCNAIDCPHLRKYLSFLDGLNETKLYDQYEQNLHYGMPFLELKMKEKAVKVDFVGAVNVLIEQNIAQIEKLKEVKSWLDWAKGLSEYKNQNGRKFGKFIMTLDFITFLHEIRYKTGDLAEKQLYTQMEIIVANSFINAVSSCYTNQLVDEKNQESHFNINGSYLCGQKVCLDDKEFE